MARAMFDGSGVVLDAFDAAGGVPGASEATRASEYVYSARQEIDRLADALNQIGK
jgi:selenocysteine lyase/cysteine desulfurase